MLEFAACVVGWLSDGVDSCLSCVGPYFHVYGAIYVTVMSKH